MNASVNGDHITLLPTSGELLHGRRHDWNGVYGKVSSCEDMWSLLEMEVVIVEGLTIHLKAEVCRHFGCHTSND